VGRTRKKNTDSVLPSVCYQRTAADPAVRTVSSAALDHTGHHWNGCEDIGQTSNPNPHQFDPNVTRGWHTARVDAGPNDPPAEAQIIGVAASMRGCDGF